MCSNQDDREPTIEERQQFAANSAARISGLLELRAPQALVLAQVRSFLGLLCVIYGLKDCQQLLAAADAAREYSESESDRGPDFSVN
jgi:hypothetical protein